MCTEEMLLLCGTAEEIKNIQESITGAYLSGRKKILVPNKRRKSNGKSIEIQDATQNNLKHLNVKFPLGVFTCITGVSGSGKSTLANMIVDRFKDLDEAIGKAFLLWNQYMQK